jgi:dTDP-glucose 4,6-dehydratase
MRVWLSGAAGFVGSHVLRHLLINTDDTVTCPVTFRHKGVPPRIAAAIDSVPDGLSRVTTVMLDLTAPIDTVTEAMIGPVDIIMSVASESHVDRSIAYPGPFIRNNVDLMTNVLDYARRVKPRMVLHMSTDEVYGPAYGDHRHREWETIAPSNPYAASKAAQEAIAFSYWRTFGVPVVITNCMNLVSPMQDGEKFVPTVIRKVLAGETVQIHASPEGVPGSRNWIDAREFADAWDFIANKHTPQMYPGWTEPSRFHIVGTEQSNLWMAQAIAGILGKPLHYELVSFHASRPGHDLRYSLDGSKLEAAGWKPTWPLEESLADIVSWYVANPAWLS